MEVAMVVDIGAILSRAYQTVMKHRILWVLGFLVALVSYTGNNNYRVSSDEQRIQIFNVDWALTPEWAAVLVAFVGAPRWTRG
jgi:hypothetical protein